MPESPVRELRLALTVTDYDHRNVRVRAPGGLQLTLFTVLDDAAPEEERP